MTPIAALADVLAQPSTLTEKPKETVISDLDPRAVRYGLMPIRDANNLPPASTSVTEIKGTKVFPFAPFPYPAHNRAESGEDTIIAERLPAEQIQDMQTLYSAVGFTELTRLAYLTPSEVREVLTAILPTEPCPKYGLELGRTCATCRYDYARTVAPRVIAEQFATRPALVKAATQTLRELIASLETGLTIARKDWQTAENDHKDPKKKPFFTDIDYRNMRHLHAVEEKRQAENAQAESQTTMLAGFEKMGEVIGDRIAAVTAPAQAAVAPLSDDERAELEQFRAKREQQLENLKKGRASKQAAE